MTALDPLWGGTLVDLRFEPAAHVIEFLIETNTGGKLDRFLLECGGVADFRFFDERTEAWDYVEVTEATSSLLPNGQRVIEMVFWDAPMGCRVVADRWSIRPVAEQ